MTLYPSLIETLSNDNTNKQYIKISNNMKIPEIVEPKSVAITNPKMISKSMDLKGKSYIADYMIIASGTSSRHIQSLSEILLSTLERKGAGKFKIEGRTSDGWKLIDAMDIIVHVFHPEKRKFYDLEKMWSEEIPKEKATV